MLCKTSCNLEMIVSTSAMAPYPRSPQARVFSTTGISSYPKLCNLSLCSCVKGWSHMCTFMAGANSSGRVMSHARTTHVFSDVKDKNMTFHFTFCQGWNGTHSMKCKMNAKIALSTVTIEGQVSRLGQRYHDICNDKSLILQLTRHMLVN